MFFAARFPALEWQPLRGIGPGIKTAQIAGLGTVAICNGIADRKANRCCPVLVEVESTLRLLEPASARCVDMEAVTTHANGNREVAKFSANLPGDIAERIGHLTSKIACSVLSAAPVVT